MNQGMTPEMNGMDMVMPMFLYRSLFIGINTKHNKKRVDLCHNRPEEVQ